MITNEPRSLEAPVTEGVGQRPRTTLNLIGFVSIRVVFVFAVAYLSLLAVNILREHRSTNLTKTKQNVPYQAFIHKSDDGCPPGWITVRGLFRERNGQFKDGCEKMGSRSSEIRLDYLAPKEAMLMVPLGLAINNDSSLFPIVEVDASFELKAGNRPWHAARVW
jgi:hypothetical protein